MRHSRIVASLFAAVLATGVVTAGAHGHSSSSDFIWSDNGESLSLHSSDGSGVVVVKTFPTPFHGLRTGDVIVSSDGHGLTSVDELLRTMHEPGKSSTTLLVRRAGSNVSLTWAKSDYRAIVAMMTPPPPPLPPVPPAPPVPPVPPAPPSN